MKLQNLKQSSKPILGTFTLLILSANIGAQNLAATDAKLVANAPSASSKITQVKLYPGSATIERSRQVKAGTRQVQFSCLPASLDVRSLQVNADAAVQIGEMAVVTESRRTSAACGEHPLASRIRELEDKKADLQAQNQALQLVNGYLQNISNGAATEGAKNNTLLPIDAKNIVAISDALRRTGQDALQKQHQLQRAEEEIDRDLAPLLQERQRTEKSNGQVIHVSVALQTAHDAKVQLSYQINGPTWAPAYRALLNSQTRSVKLERQALVSQSTGEDWQAARLVLSTGQPNQNASVTEPRSWLLDIAQRAKLEVAYKTAMLAPAPATARMGLAEAMDDSAEEIPQDFNVLVEQAAYATEFTVPNLIDVPSGKQRVAIALGQFETPAKLAVRTVPSLDARAFLIADIVPPEGVWPSGAMQLYRDGVFVGASTWATSDAPAMTLSFGHDELVRVQLEPANDMKGNSGFTGSQTERKISHAFKIENRHKSAIALQVLEASPVSKNEKIRIKSTFTPEPTERDWNKQAGIVLWTTELAAGASTRFEANYVITHPKELDLLEFQ